MRTHETTVPSKSRFTDKKHFISIIIPTFNEEYAIRQVLSLIPYRELEQAEVIVIDGGSSDGTIEIAKSLGVSVKPQSKPGYAWTIIEAISHARGDILVFLDGDGSYDPREIPKLLGVMKEENADLVIGSRFRGEVMPGAIPRIRLLGSKLLNLLISILLDLRITDIFSGFIVVRKEAISKLERLPEQPPEPVKAAVIAEVHQRRGRVIEAPVTFYPRMGKSKLASTSIGLRILFSFLRRKTSFQRRLII